MKKALFPILSAVAVFFATVVASSACIWYYYQPQEPKCLSDK